MASQNLRRKGTTGQAPPTSTPHSTITDNQAASTGGNHGHNNVSKNMPLYAAVVAKGFAAPCPLTKETPASDTPTTR